MLSRYDGKTVRVTTSEGGVFIGTAESYPSGYGLHEFGVAEESVEVDDTQIFLSDIVSIEDLSSPPAPDAREGRYDPLMGTLLDGPYYVADILPAQVPRDAKGQYFAVDRWYRQPAQMARLRRMQAEVLLRLNCYYDMLISFDGGERWETNPDPETFVTRCAALEGSAFLRALFPPQRTMIDIEPDDTWMTVYCPQPDMQELIRQLAAGAGFFFWQPPQGS